MSSMILGFLRSGIKSIANAFRKSKLCAVIDKVYGFFSVAWEKSKIMSVIRGNKKEGAPEGIISRLMHTTYRVWDFFAKKIGRALNSSIKNSVIIGLARDFTNSALALNARFLGLLLLSLAVAGAIISYKISALMLAIAIIGCAFVLLNCNFTKFLCDSKIVKFALSILGFSDISWDFYDERTAGNVKSLICAVVMGIAMGILPLKLSILIPFAVCALTIVMSYPIVGVFLAVFAAPFVPTMVLAGICLLTFFSLIIKALIKEDFKWKLDNVGVGLKIFLVLMLISSILSFSRTKSLMVWSMYLVFVGFYLVIINVVKTKEQLFSILKVFAIAGFFVSLYGIIQYVFGLDTTNAWIDEEMFEEATMRAYSTMENPNVLGEYLLLIIPISAVFMLKSGCKKLSSWFYGGVFLISLICLILTQSRGCWLGVMLSALIFITFYNGRLWSLFPLVLLALAFIIPEAIINRMLSVGNMEDSSTSYRVFIWLGTLRMLKDFALGGIGMGEGAYRSVYPLYSYNAIIAPHSHNTFLQLLVEGGIVALLVFLVIMFVFLKNTARAFKNSPKNSKDSLMLLAIGSGTCGFLLQSMFDYTFYNYRMMAMFFMFMALGSLFNLVGEDKVSENN